MGAHTLIYRGRTQCKSDSIATRATWCAAPPTLQGHDCGALIWLPRHFRVRASGSVLHKHTPMLGAEDGEAARACCTHANCTPYACTPQREPMSPEASLVRTLETPHATERTQEGTHASHTCMRCSAGGYVACTSWGQEVVAAGAPRSRAYCRQLTGTT
jgi:hypothetical protein